MKEIEWDASYSVNVAIIDAQHQELVRLLNKSIKGTELEDCAEVVSEILSGMLDYAEFHFRTESDLMEQHKYAKSEIHNNEHTDFIEKAVEYSTAGDMNREIAIQINKFLKEWLLNHIGYSDKQLGMFLNKRGIF